MGTYGPPEELAGMVEYGEGSVVSRTLIDRPTGTVTLFAFAKEQGLSEHTAPFDAMVTVLEGTGMITIAEQVFHVKAGEMLVMPADIPHALRAEEPFKMLLVMVRS
ncbi:cupin [Candidatus Fermentibacteria bacterium]|nr:MAG: cupin [Candidatus Fermentibacteria bacterium]